MVGPGVTGPHYPRRPGHCTRSRNETGAHHLPLARWCREGGRGLRTLYTSADDRGPEKSGPFSLSSPWLLILAGKEELQLRQGLDGGMVGLTFAPILGILLMLSLLVTWGMSLLLLYLPIYLWGQGKVNQFLGLPGAAKLAGNR